MSDLAVLGIKVDASEVDPAVASLDKLTTAGSKTEAAVGGVGKASTAASRDVRTASQAADDAVRAFGGLKSMLVGLGIATIANDIIQTNAQFQSLNASLKSATGSAEAASVAMADIKKFASETPYALEKSVQAFLKLKNLGLDPSTEAMRSYGNTASSMGKDIMQMVEAVADATTGEFERLKEFGIKARKEGDNVTFTFQGVSTTVKNSGAEIEKFLQGLGNANFAGAMAEQMNTLNGQWSNLQDNIDSLYVSIGTLGANNALTTMLNAASQAVAFLTANLGTIITVLGSVVVGLGAYAAATAAATAVNALMNSSLGLVAGVVVSTTSKFGILAGAQVAYSAATAAATSVTKSLTAAIAANPFGAAAIAIGALAGAMFYYSNRTAQARAETNNLISSLKALAQARSADFGLQLAKAQIEQNKLVERRLQIEIDIDKQQKTTLGRSVAYERITARQNKELTEVNQQLLGMTSEINLAKNAYEQAGKAAEKIAIPVAKAAVATGALAGSAKGAGKAIGKNLGEAAKDETDKWLKDLQNDWLQVFVNINQQLDETFKASNDNDWAETMAAVRRETEGAVKPYVDLLSAQGEFNEEFARLKEIAGSIDFGSVFGRGGDAIDGMVASMARLEDAQVSYVTAMMKADKLTGQDQIVAKTKAEKAYSSAKLNGAVAYLGAAKSLFREESAGAKAMEAAQKALMAVQLVKTGIDVAGGAAKMFASLGPFAFPAVAAMLAVMAGLGFKGSGGGGGYKPPSAEEMQASTGTGTVLGDSSAKSASIENALGIMAANSNKDLEYSNNMVGYLRSISSGIGALTTAISRQLGLGSGGSFSTSDFNLGSNSGGGVLGLFSTTTTRTLYDQGLETFGQTVSEILAQGVQAQVYNVIEQVKKNSGFLGIGGSTKATYETVTGQIPAQIESQFNLIIKDITNSVISYAEQLGTDVSGAIGNMQIEPARLSFVGMTGDEIQKSLEAYFSSVADHLAGALDVSGLNLESLQKAGEGLYETLARVTRTMMTVTSSLSSIGMSLDSVGGNYSVGAVAPARDALVGQFGGLDAFQEAISAFSDKFLTEAEKMQPVIAAVNAEMARLGESGVTTKDQFRALVQGLDLSTDAGQQMFASLLSVAPAFAKVDDYLTKLNATTGETAKTLEQLAAIEKQRQSLQIDLMTAQGDTAGALAARRASELATMDESLRSLQQLVWDTQDATKAQTDLAAAQKEAADTANTLAKLHRGLEIELMEATGNAAGALAAKRQDELAALDASLRPIKEQIYAAQDAAIAAEALADAQKAQAEVAAQAASEAAALMSQKKDLEIQYMEAKGNAEVAVALQRAKEMAALDASLRPLQRAIYAAEDAAKAQEALAEAQAAEAETARKAADDAIAIASQRAGLEIALLRATGSEAEAVNLERARELAALPEVLRALQQQIYTANDATTAANALSAAQAEQAATAKAIAAERHSLEIRLMDATGDSIASLAAKRADEWGAINEVNRSLLGLIYAAEDAKKASDALAATEKTQAEAAAQAAQATMALAKERASLEIRLMEATGDSVSALAAKRAQEMEAADESLRSLLSAIYAAEDASTAARAAADALADAQKIAEQASKDAADAQAAATKAAEDAAKAAKDLADKRASIEIELMQALGDASGALAAQRALELAALDPTLRALKDQVYAAEDAATAAKAAADAQAILTASQAAAADAAAKQAEAVAVLAEQRRSLEITLAEALGNTNEALAMRRADELAALDASLRGIQSQIYAAEDATKAAEALAEAQGVAADAARAQAEAEADLVEQRRGLEIELAEALGNSSEALAMRRADELAALDESLRGIQSQVYAAEDATKAAEALAEAQGVAADAARAQAEAEADLVEQRRGLEIELAEALGNSSEALAMRRADELAAMDASLRGLLQQIFAAEDAAKAAEALAEAQSIAAKDAEKAAEALARAQEDATKAALEQAKAEADLAKQRRGLEIDLTEALGNSAEALAMRRADELAAMDESLRGLKAQIYAAEDAAKAADELARAQGDAANAAQELADKTAAIAKEQQGLMIRYYEAAGNSAAALALRREQELASTDESNRALLLQIYALEDAKTAQEAYSQAVEKHSSTIASARDALSNAYEREAGALQDTIKQFGDFGDSLRKFRAGLFAADQGSSASYRQLQVDFIKTAALAATGDRGGLGGLEGSGSAFLDASRAQSSSLVQYQRDVAMVARSVETAIGAADEAVDYAQAQLDALTRLVGGYIDLNKTEISVLEAINQLRTAMADDVMPATVAPIVTTQQEQTEVIRDGNAELKAEVVGLKVALAQAIAALTDKVASIDRREAKYDQGTHKAIGGVGTETVPVDTTP